MDSSSSQPEDQSQANPFPSAPSFYSDPDYQWWQSEGKAKYGYLMNGLTTQGGSLSGQLGEATQLSPDISRLSQQYAKSQLDPQFRQNRQNTVNTLEANNQLTGSTTASALGNLDSDYMASLTGMQAQYGIADVTRALDNRVKLFGTGLNLGQNIGANGLANQGQMNNFNLMNYDNQMAQWQASQPQTSQGGSWIDSLLGGLGGIMGSGGGGSGGGLGGLTSIFGGGGSNSSAYGNNSGQALASMGSLGSGLFGTKSNTGGGYSLGAESTFGTSSYAPNSYYQPLNSQSVGLR